MGKPNGSAADAAIALVAGSFTGIAVSDTLELRGDFNLSLAGFGTASVALQRSFDGGANWRTVDSFAGAAEMAGLEPESGMLYRLDCTDYTDGTIAYRLSR